MKVKKRRLLRLTSSTRQNFSTKIRVLTDNKSFAKNFQKRGSSHSATCTLQDELTYVCDLRRQFSRKGGNADASLAYDAESCVVCFCLQIPDAEVRKMNVTSYGFFEGVPFCL